MTIEVACVWIAGGGLSLMELRHAKTDTWALIVLLCCWEQEVREM